MRHPFDGIVTPMSATRRSWLGGALATVAGLVFGSRAFAVAPPSKAGDVDPEPKPKATQKRGEDGKPSTEAAREEAATLALNENGGPTTKALREEAMTRALNENGIKPVPVNPRVTTLALNEEGANK
jgi:hypothetical protein